MPGKDALDMSLDDRIKQAQKDRRKRKASPGNNNSSTTNTKKAATGTGITTQASKRPKRNLSSSGAKNKRPAPLPNIKVTIVNDKAKTKAAAPAAAKPKPAARTTRNSNRKASINNENNSAAAGSKIELKTRRLSTSKHVDSTMSNVKVWNVKNDIDSEAFFNVFKNEAEGVKSGKINADANGRSTGTGVLTFSSLAFAQKFVKDYDGVDLDGQPIKLELE
eukprot:TRINITY_DN5034_c0_g1_i2.p1 TRINITY_DN5034_c0_g1~~TRINITY_DN5034_c0_g1_i2.p1  ORF type:complete len:221 (-),score=68.25 TRINITY_DN5034_c0_g1_i2:62-724(-)